MDTRPLLIFIGSLVGLTAPAVATAQCSPAPEAKTIWGGNMHPINREAKPVKSIHGTAQDQLGAPLANVLVEVYDHPELMATDPSAPPKGQTRIAACMTNSTGTFSLNAPPGQYEIRVSKSDEWDVSSVLVAVRSSAKPSKKGIVVTMKLGT